MPKPVPTPMPAGTSAPVVREEAPPLWRFSFRFWKQIKYFGVNQSHSKWFVSLLERLSQLSKEPVPEVFIDGGKRDAARYHPINWEQPNIPISKNDLTWVDSDYRDDREYPLLQFQISQALGRVVGFWDEQQTFNIVLLDPLHNIQPSKRFDYAVTPCFPLDSEYTSILHDFETVRAKPGCGNGKCPLKPELAALPRRQKTFEASVLFIKGDVLVALDEVLAQGKAASIEDVLMSGVLQAMDQKP